MSSSKENNTISKYRNNLDQLKNDKPFRFGSSKNLPKTNLFQNDYTNDLLSSRPKNVRKSINLGHVKKDEIINNIYKANNISTKIIQKRFSLFHKTKESVEEILNNDIEKPTVNIDEENTTNKIEKPRTYSTYTSIKTKKFRSRFDKETEDEKNEKMEKISKSDLVEYFEENYSNVIKDFTYKENQNENYRAYMEDKGVSVLNLNGDPDKALFCLFDGHGGEEVSKFLQDNFIKEFKEMLPFDDVKTNLNKLFLKIDLKIKELELIEIGAAACIIYITKEKGKRCLYSANVGDTRSILISKNEFKRLSYDHKADDAEESKRIVKDGGIVFGGRVYGSLMIGRAFGDWQLKSHGVSCEPHITRINISNDDKYVILATDGIWDTIEESLAFDLSKKYDNSKEFCNTLVNKAIDKGSMDNISCFVINL